VYLVEHELARFHRLGQLAQVVVEGAVREVHALRLSGLAQVVEHVNRTPAVPAIL